MPPSRAARSFTCAVDSSPVTSSARRPAAEIAPSALEQERRLADARLAADEHEAGRHEPAAEDAVELGNAGRDPLRLLGVDVDEAEERPGGGRRGLQRAGASSTSEPNASQPGHLPNHRPAE